MKKNVHRKKWNVFLILIIMIINVLSPIIIHAEEEGLSYYVTPVFPESQVEGNSQYFNINASPGSTEKLTLNLQNANDKKKRIQITPHTAFTNVMGVVEYGKDAQEPDPTLSHSLDDLIERPAIVELDGKETKTITIELKMPSKAFEGFLAGGLSIREVIEEEDSEIIEEEGLAIKNEFSYVIGIIVSNSRDSVQPDLDLLDVFADQLNYRNVISANIQNYTPTFVNRLAVEATIHRAGENEVLYKANKEMMQMAPNSNFNFPISLEGDRFSSGEYLLKMRASSGEDEWQWERKFTIEADEARMLNRADVTIDSSFNWWMIGSIVLMILLLVIFILWMLKKRKKKDYNDPE